MSLCQSIQELILENVKRVEGIRRFRAQMGQAEENGHGPATNTTAKLGNGTPASENGLLGNGTITGQVDSGQNTPEREQTKPDKPPSENGTSPAPTKNGGTSNLPGSTPANAVVAVLSMPCANLEQLKTVVPHLVEHAILASEDRVSKRLTTRYKDKFLERCSPAQFCQFEALIRAFLRRSRALVPAGSALSLDLDRPEGLTPQRSPLIGTIQLQTAKFIVAFQESTQQKLRSVPCCFCCGSAVFLAHGMSIRNHVWF